MAETEVAVKFTTKEEAQLFQAFVKLTAGFSKVKDGAEKTKKSTDDVDASLRKFAQNEIKLNTRDIDAGVARFAKLDAALKANLITQEQHAAATARHRAKLDEPVLAEAAKAAAEAERAAEREREAASRRAEKDREKEAAKLQQLDEHWTRYAESVREANRTPLESLQAKLDKLEAAHKRGKLSQEEWGRATKAAHDQYQRELGSSATKQTELTAGAVAAGAMIAQAWGQAISIVGRAGAAMAQEHQRAKGAQQASGRSLGSLAQIAESPEEMASLSNLARGLVESGAAPDMGVAVNTVFDAKSSGSLQDLEQLRTLAEPGVVGNLSEVIKSAASLKSAMGSESTGGVADLLAKAFAAAGPSTASAEGILVGAARAGSQAKSEGVSVDELLAATGVIATSRGSAEEGGTRMAALLRGMEDDPELRGKGLVQRIESIQSRNLAPQELTKQLTAEGADAFRILANNLEELRATSLATANQVTAETFERKRSIAVSDRAVNVDMLSRQVTARGDMAREAEGRVLTLQDAAVDQGVTERRLGARGGLGEYIPFLRHVLPDSLKREANAASFRGMMGVWGASPGSALPEAAAQSDRTSETIRAALRDAIAERDDERARFADSVRSSADTMARAAASLERAASRVDRTGPARREAAAAHGGG